MLSIVALGLPIDTTTDRSTVPSGPRAYLSGPRSNSSQTAPSTSGGRLFDGRHVLSCCVCSATVFDLSG